MKHAKYCNKNSAEQDANKCQSNFEISLVLLKITEHTRLLEIQNSVKWVNGEIWKKILYLHQFEKVMQCVLSEAHIFWMVYFYEKWLYSSVECKNLQNKMHMLPSSQKWFPDCISNVRHKIELIWYFRVKVKKSVNISNKSKQSNSKFKRESPLSLKIH